MFAIEPSAHPEDVTLLSAQTLTALYVRRELSPVEVVKRTLERIEALNDRLRMFTWTAPQAALAAAREAEAAYRRGTDVAQLAGVPFSVKDTIAVQGAPLTFGSALFAGQVAPADSPAVARLRSAGAVFVGMTNMPEFGHRPTNENAHYGTARNPWDTERTPGGSSGGSAAAVATGASVLSIGTDAGGSVRIPASCCGVLGIKATHGLVPSADALDAFGALVQIGPLARAVSDLAWSLDVMAGKHESDPWSYAVPRQHLRAAARADGDLRALRIAWLPYLAAGDGAEGLDEQVRALCEQALHRLAGLGAAVARRHADLAASSAILAAIAGALNQHRYGHLLREHGEDLPAGFRARVQAGGELTCRQLQQGLVDRTSFFRRVQALFEDADVLATPTLSAPPVPAQADPTAPLVIDGHAWGPLRTAWIHHCHPFNVSGNPALSVPVGWTRAGLPVGLQFVGPWYAEARLLKVVAELEALSPWTHRRPPVLDPPS